MASSSSVLEGIFRIKNGNLASKIVIYIFCLTEITDLDASTFSDEETHVVTCTYSGTDEPSSVVWTVDGSTKTSDDEGYTVSEGSLSSDVRNDELSISGRAYTDASKAITCTYSFDSTSDTLQASTTLYWRGM